MGLYFDTYLGRYLMYLRKSRMDTDYAEVSVEETLQRHRRILDAFCKEHKINVVKVLEEVASGESLSSRPQMLQLLELVNTGQYAGVVCIDIERLSRGSAMETGYIMQILQTNGCKIITPSKVYDLQNESDEQFTDMKFMFSRYELKTITKRLVRGRNQSASEGKFMGSMAPYGYRPYKLPGEKGNSLMIVPEEAQVVSMIFDMYGQQSMGYNAIAYKLNDMHIPARKGEWSQTSISNVLTNEVYLGKIRWRKEPVKRVVRDGMISKKRIRNDNYELYEGRHEAIITQEQWELAKKVQSQKYHASQNTNRDLKNPFAGILYCGKCGGIMKRNIPGKQKKPWFRCMTRGCDCKIIKCETVEKAVRDAMEDWLKGYIIQLESEQKAGEDPVETALQVVRSQIAGLQLQQESICEYLEKGVYTVDMFTKRNTALMKEIKQLQISEADLLCQKEDGDQRNEVGAQLIPTTQHILDSYPMLTPEEKNKLWKLVMKKATVYRSQDDELTIHVYPNLPGK